MKASTRVRQQVKATVTEINKKQDKLKKLELFLDLISELEQYDIKTVAESAGVNQSTIYHWLTGVTKTPRLDTFFRVAKAIGFDVRLIKTKADLRVA